DSYLSELLRLDGRHYSMSQVTCSDCSTPVTSLGYRCLSCEDSRMYCKACMVGNHSQNPFHRIQLWNGSFFSRDTLRNLGFVLSLGHPTGQICPCASLAVTKTLVVLDMTGVHTVEILYFQAQDEVRQLLRSRLYPATQSTPRTAATFRLLEHFHILSFVSKASVRDYYASLERMTDNTSSVNVLDRYRELLRMVREWRLLKLLKRHGRGHEESGYKGTKRGECVVRCAACPIPEVNLPPGWRLVSKARAYVLFLWLYRLFLSLDANFRCVRLQVSSEEADPSLNQGCAYIIDSGIARDHVQKYGKSTADDVSNCSNHKALKLASMLRDRGLAATGLATTDCSRHDAKLPCSCTDLTAGERYRSKHTLNFPVLGSSRNIAISITFKFQSSHPYTHVYIRQLPSYQVQVTGISTGISWFLGLPSIRAKRRWYVSLDFYSLVGDSAEGPSSLDVPQLNYLRALGYNSDVREEVASALQEGILAEPIVSFLVWAKENSDGREDAVTSFQIFDAGIPKETGEEWRKAVENWEGNPELYPNPYEPTVKGKLAEAEADELSQLPITDTASLSSLLIEGLDLRELQRKLAQELAGTTSYTEKSKSKMLEKANGLRRRIDAWCNTQALYFPASAIIRDKLSQGATSTSVTEIPLLLPSDLIRHSSKSVHLSALKLQWELEYALAEDTLETIRQGLLQRTYLCKWKDRYSHGQKSSTRSSATISRLQDRINNSAARYRISRKALASLAPFIEAAGWDNILKDLKPEDIRPLNRDDIDPDLQAQLVRNPSLQVPNLPSWIWCMEGINREGEAGMQDALRIGWCKARARALQYQEECLLLQEEMRRVLATYDFEADVWGKCANNQPTTTLPLEYWEGRRAYAEYQRSIRLKMSAECQKKWEKLPQNFLSGEGAIRLGDEVYNFV
ncbi:hypothetical protein K435DRAFT_696936, partial [Dendrothele bispora CBS 962.96]